MKLLCCHHLQEVKMKLTKEETERYNRQIRIPEIGEAGQQLLKSARVLVVGAGGLGCPILQYMAAGGIGEIGIADFDTVSLSNLHRQILFNENDLNKPKALVAAEKIKLLNPLVNIIPYNVRINSKNVISLLESYDIIVDACDSIELRYILSDACALLNKPMVYGAIYQFEGQVGVFGEGTDGIYLSYRDLFPYSNKLMDGMDCNTLGVLGTLPGIIGLYQVNEVFKYVLTLGDSLLNKVMLINTLQNSSVVLEISSSGDRRPHNMEEFNNWNYTPVVCDNYLIKKLDGLSFKDVMNKNSVAIVDVRGREELPELNFEMLFNIPLPLLNEKLDELKCYNEIVFICKSGKRSLNAALQAQKHFPEKIIYNLEGGLDSNSLI